MKTLTDHEIEQVSGAGNFDVPFTFSFAGDGLRRETSITRAINVLRPIEYRPTSAFVKVR